MGRLLEWEDEFDWDDSYLNLVKVWQPTLAVDVVCLEDRDHEFLCLQTGGYITGAFENEYPFVDSGEEVTLSDHDIDTAFDHNEWLFVVGFHENTSHPRRLVVLEDLGNRQYIVFDEVDRITRNMYFGLNVEARIFVPKHTLES